MIWLSVTAWLVYQRRFRLLLVLVPVFAFVFVFVLAPWVFALWKTGGGAYLRGLVVEVAEQTGLEVVIGNAFDGLKVAENMTGFGPIYAVAVGLASEED